MGKVKFLTTKNTQSLVRQSIVPIIVFKLGDVNKPRI